MTRLAIAAAAGVAWFFQQPANDWARLTCKPLLALAPYVKAQESPRDPYAHGMNRWIDNLIARCPDAVGEKVARLSREAEDAVGRAEDSLRARRIVAVLDGERLKVCELGEVWLLGVTVPPERHAAARDHLIKTVEGKSFRIATGVELDPERRPLVLVTRKNGTRLNAVLIQEGLVTPWKRPGAWHTWTRRLLSDSP